MYWASQNSNQQLRLFSWADGQNTINWWNVTVSQYATAITSTAPNGIDWLWRADTRITGATVGNGVITFTWTAGNGTNRPHAYCKVVRINESNKQLIDEPDIWSNDRAWAYPAACTNGSGLSASPPSTGSRPQYWARCRCAGRCQWKLGDGLCQIGQ